jgi:hypothetical protein
MAPRFARWVGVAIGQNKSVAINGGLVFPIVTPT